MGKKQELQDRWDTFLDNVENRFTTLMGEAEQGCAQLLDLNNLDPLAMSNAWSAMEAQVHALSDKISDTWDDKVEEQLEDAGVKDKHIEACQTRGEALSDWLYREQTRREVKIFADASKKMLTEAEKILAKGFNCTQCGGQLKVPKQFFLASHVACEYCEATNTFEPGTQVRMVEVFCADNLAREAAMAEWECLEDIKATVDSKRNAKLPLLQEYEAAYQAYYQRFYTERSKIVPAADRIEADVQTRMQYFYQDMQHEKHWDGPQPDNSPVPAGNGQTVYQEWLATLKDHASDSSYIYAQLQGGPYINEQALLIAEPQIAAFKEHIMTLSHVQGDYAHSLVADGKFRIDNFAPGDVELPKKIKSKGFSDDDRDDYEKLFPGLIPFAYDGDDFHGEIYFVDSKHPAYPVMFMNGACFAYVAGSLENFIKTVNFSDKT